MIAKYSILNQTSIAVSRRGLDAYTHRSKAIANNLANVTTPGYKRIEVEFEQKLRQYLDENMVKGERTNHNHFRHGRPELDEVIPKGVRSQDPVQAGEINNVDIDLEMAKLAENHIMYNMGVKFIQDRMTAIQESIK
jgi:flagellar basal-body rod protein FlgB